MTAYRACTDRDLPALKNIWLSCFEEREDATELFFKRNKEAFHAYACETDGSIVSALYLIDCSLGGKSVHYLCGAATLPEYRGNGLMSALIRYALDDAKRRGDRYSLLFPASDSLYGFYEKFGYQPARMVKSMVFDVAADRKTRSESPDLHALQARCPDGNCLIWEDAYIRFAAEYYGCYGAKTAQSADAFAIYQPEGDIAEVYYAIYSDTEALKALLSAAGIRRFRMTIAANDPASGGERIRPYGMILSLRGEKAPADVNIGITLQ